MNSHRPSYESLLPASGNKRNKAKQAQQKRFAYALLFFCLVSLVVLLRYRRSEAPVSVIATAARRRIAIVQHNSYDETIFNSRDNGSVINHQHYAEIHGYPFVFGSAAYVEMAERPLASGTLESSKENGYNKVRSFPSSFPQEPEGKEQIVQAMHAILDGIASREYDWIFVCDGDTWIIQPSILLESMLPPPELDAGATTEPHFIATVDQRGCVASSKGFLQSTYSHVDSTPGLTF
jgi:hypothetical protein